MRANLPRALRLFLWWLAWALFGTLVAAAPAIEQAVEHASIDDRLGTFPVEVRLSHNGVVMFDSGILGKVYWKRAAIGGFGAEIRSAGPPLAGGSLASYVTPTFLRANAQFVANPSEVASAYATELRHQIVVGTIRYAVIGGLLLGTVGFALVRGRSPLPSSWPQHRRRAFTTGAVTLTIVCSMGLAMVRFHHWSGPDPSSDGYALPGHPEIVFSSPEVRELAQQIQPFIEKNTERIQRRADEYVATATESIERQVPLRVAGLSPRDGEMVVLAEADPQGSEVGTRVRRVLYSALKGALSDDGPALRTIAGDITSNGTVAEAAFVDAEIVAGSDIPVVAAKGDHDTAVTVQQLIDAGAEVPDTETVEVAGLRVASARDPEFKSLFGGLVRNDTDLSEENLGAGLRKAVEDDEPDEPLIVELHQPDAVAGYLGVDLGTWATATSLTTPVDDGIPDVPPGIVTYGHLHDPRGPWVIWNTDGDEVTWTLVSQLGTSGGVQESPTFDRFSTPFSVPLKPISVQLQYLDKESRLPTGYLELTISTNGALTIGDRVDVGLPGGQPLPLGAATSAP